MIARASQLFLPTLREAPADAEAASHRLLVRGGFIRQIGAGLWAMLPLGWRVHMRIEQIIREEMDAVGGQEMHAPTLTPAELWETTGRIDVPILFHLNDSGGRPFVLSWTHEESMTFLAREIQSYKQLPQVWYHFSTKDRDEPRPRGGLLRLREFIMKDSYTFDADETGLDAAFARHEDAYKQIFERCGLAAYLVEAEPGEARDLLRGRVPSGDRGRDPRRLRCRRRLARSRRHRRRGDRRRGPPRGPVRRRSKRGRQAPPWRPGRPRLRADVRRHPPGEGR